jgi:hypothetical protein
VGTGLGAADTVGTGGGRPALASSSVGTRRRGGWRVSDLACGPVRRAGVCGFGGAMRARRRWQRGAAVQRQRRWHGNFQQPAGVVRAPSAVLSEMAMRERKGKSSYKGKVFSTGLWLQPMLKGL